MTASNSSKTTLGTPHAEKLTPEEQRHRFIEAAREAGASEAEAETAMRDVEKGLAALEGSLKAADRPKGKKAEAITPTEQKRRFEELSRELGTDNGETLDKVFGKIVPAKVRSEP